MQETNCDQYSSKYTGNLQQTSLQQYLNEET